jgi:nucleoside-diphosphate-sugar epimerase
VLNRGRTSATRPLPDGVTGVTADVQDADSMHAALTGTGYDVVANFLSYDAKDAAAMVDLLAGRVGQYLHISSASIYHKPIRKGPVTESTRRHNPFLAYARDKIAAEEVLERAYEERDFPVTIVRPSHTYDDANPPLPGGWTAWDRIVRGAELLAPGDGTSLWTVTHAADLAVALVGLAGNPQAVGEAFHITSDEVLTWDEIYRIIALSAGVAARPVHLPAEFLPLVAPDWLWSDLIVGDLGHSAVFDNTKIRRFVPAFRPTITWAEGVRRLVTWRAAHPAATAPDPATDAVLERLVRAHHAARAAVATLTT